MADEFGVHPHSLRYCLSSVERCTGSRITTDDRNCMIDRLERVLYGSDPVYGMMHGVVDALSTRLVPDALWEIVEPLLPRFSPRPQGGGRAALDDRAVFTAVVYVLTSGCAWRHLPPSFGVSVPTAHRRFAAWAKAGVFDELHRQILDRLGAGGDLDWSAAILDAAHVRAKRGAL